MWVFVEFWRVFTKILNFDRFYTDLSHSAAMPPKSLCAAKPHSYAPRSRLPKISQKKNYNVRWNYSSHLDRLIYFWCFTGYNFVSFIDNGLKLAFKIHITHGGLMLVRVIPVVVAFLRFLKWCIFHSRLSKFKYLYFSMFFFVLWYVAFIHDSISKSTLGVSGIFFRNCTSHLKFFETVWIKQGDFDSTSTVHFE